MWSFLGASTVQTNLLNPKWFIVILRAQTVASPTFTMNTVPKPPLYSLLEGTPYNATVSMTSPSQQSSSSSSPSLPEWSFLQASTVQTNLLKPKWFMAIYRAQNGARVLPSPWVQYQSLPCSCCWRVPHPTPRGPGCTPHWTNTALSSCWGSWPGAWGPGQVCPQTSWWCWGQEHYHVLHSNSHATTIQHCQYTTSVFFFFLRRRKSATKGYSQNHIQYEHIESAQEQRTALC